VGIEKLKDVVVDLIDFALLEFLLGKPCFEIVVVLYGVLGQQHLPMALKRDECVRVLGREAFDGLQSVTVRHVAERAVAVLEHAEPLPIEVGEADEDKVGFALADGKMTVGQSANLPIVAVFEMPFGCAGCGCLEVSSVGLVV
jgi:hypothetical protein